MCQQKPLQSGDLVRFPNERNPGKQIYGIVFYLEEKLFLLMPDGSVLVQVPIDSLEWVCNTALVHCDIFRSLKQVQDDFASGRFDNVVGPLHKLMEKAVV